MVSRKSPHMVAEPGCGSAEPSERFCEQIGTVQEQTYSLLQQSSFVGPELSTHLARSEVKGAADRPSRIQVSWSSILVDKLRSSVVVAQAAAHRLIARKAAAGGSDEVWETVVSAKQVHMTWTDDATMNEDKPCLQRDVTEVDVSRRGAGRTCLMFVVIPRCAVSTEQWSIHGNLCHGGLLRGSVVPAKFLA